MPSFTGKMLQAKVGRQTLREPPQSKCTWTCHKSLVYAEICKERRPNPDGAREHPDQAPALTLEQEPFSVGILFGGRKETCPHRPGLQDRLSIWRGAPALRACNQLQQNAIGKHAMLWCSWQVWLQLEVAKRMKSQLGGSSEQKQPRQEAAQRRSSWEKRCLSKEAAHWRSIVSLNKQEQLSHEFIHPPIHPFIRSFSHSLSQWFNGS